MDEQALLTKRLEQLLARECKVYSQYLKLMELEQAALRKNNLDQFQAYTTERAGLYEIMMESQEVRLELMRSQPHKPNMTLRSWILENFEPQYSKRLLPLAAELRKLALHTRSRGREHNQIVGFALKVVNGILSKIWSATENVVQSYTKSGKQSQTRNPQGRHTSVLKEA